MAGNSVLEFKVLAEPFLTLFTKVFDILPSFTAADGTAKRQNDDVTEAVLKVAVLATRVNKSLKA